MQFLRCADTEVSQPISPDGLIDEDSGQTEVVGHEDDLVVRVAISRDVDDVVWIVRSKRT
jgi:hypothetical protein